MIDFEFPTFKPTGAIETTDFVDVDRAVASFFRDQLAAFFVTDDKRDENREFASFQARDTKRKLYVGQFDDPNEFVRKLVAKIPDAKNRRAEIFPTAYISRDESISFCDGTDYIDITEQGEILCNDGHRVAIVNKSFAKINYTLNILAWNKSTIGRMALGVAMCTRHTMSQRKRKLTAKTMLANTPVTLNIELNIPRDAIGEPISAPFDEQRLNGVSFSFEVIAEVLEAVFVEGGIKRVVVDTPSIMEDGGEVTLGGGEVTP